MRRPRVLIVDDDRLAQAQLAELYRAAGYDPDVVGTAAEALARLAQEPPDLVVVDLVLPDLFGTELVARLKADGRLRRVPVIATTSRLDPNYMAASFRAGAADFLYKPLPAPDVIERSRVALERAAAGADALPANRGRRDLAALFCDIRGFTAFAARKDPETVVDVLNGLFDRLVTAVAERGGHVDKFIGDGLLALFGAFDDSGHNEVRAVQTALAMVEQTQAFNDESLALRGHRVAVGIGIASGDAVVGAVGGRVRREVTAIGDALNLASRLQGLAGENEVLLSERARQRAGGAVQVSEPWQERVKGFAEPQLVYRVRAAG